MNFSLWHPDFTNLVVLDWQLSPIISMLKLQDLTVTSILIVSALRPRHINHRFRCYLEPGQYVDG